MAISFYENLVILTSIKKNVIGRKISMNLAKPYTGFTVYMYKLIHSLEV